MNVSEQGCLIAGKTIISQAENPWGCLPLFNTTFHQAAKDGNEKTVKELIESHFPIDVKDKNESSALHYASQNGHASIARALLENGASADQIDQYGNTPMHFAVVNGHEEIVQALLQKKESIRINREDYQGNTYLHLAVKNGSESLVALLARHGLSPHKKNRQGKTPLDLAKNGQHETIVKLLAAIKTDVDSPAEKETESGTMALNYYLKEGNGGFFIYSNAYHL